MVIMMSGNTHVGCQLSVLNGGREKYFCGARKYEIPSEDKYKVDAGQIQSQSAQIRYRDWDKSDIKGFRQLSRGCWLRRLWESQQPQRWRLLILMRMGTRVRKRNPLWEWSMLDLWSDPLWKCRSRKVKVEIVKTSEECHRWNQKSLVIWMADNVNIFKTCQSSWLIHDIATLNQSCC